MLVLKVSPTNLHVVFKSDSPNGDEIQALTNALKDYQNRCESVRGVRGGPCEEADAMRADLPIINLLLEKMA